MLEDEGIQVLIGFITLGQQNGSIKIRKPPF